MKNHRKKKRRGEKKSPRSGTYAQVDNIWAPAYMSSVVSFLQRVSSKRPPRVQFYGGVPPACLASCGFLFNCYVFCSIARGGIDMSVQVEHAIIIIRFKSFYFFFYCCTLIERFSFWSFYKNQFGFLFKAEFEWFLAKIYINWDMLYLPKLVNLLSFEMFRQFLEKIATSWIALLSLS